MNRQKNQQIEHTVVKSKVGGESGPVDGNLRRPSVACTLAIRVNPHKFPASWAKILNITLNGKGGANVHWGLFKQLRQIRFRWPELNAI